MNNMEVNNKDLTKREKRLAVLCISIGTGAGLIIYGLFLYFHIDIFGWNLGLIFAPLGAGYVETVVANKLIGEDIGAISAFILFIDTVIYSFILKNPTLGWNLITAGSIIVILQAAFPTLINYILLVVLGGVLSNFIKKIKDYENRIRYSFKKQQYVKWDGPDVEEDDELILVYDEHESNQKINDLDFYFITSTDMKSRKHEIVGIYQTEVILEKDRRIIKLEPEKAEQKVLSDIKEGKDDCLLRLAEKIKKDGGNGILNLTMSYNLIGIGGDNIQITARGMGININEEKSY